MATPTKDENTEKEAQTEGQDGPLLDLSDDAVKKMIKAAKKRGYVTVDELNSVLPSDEVTSEQIEDTMAMLSDMGINVVEEDEAEEESESTELVEAGDRAVTTTKKREPTDRTDDPVRMYLR
ncbi:MAG: RNA polymerase sigma factor RpoD, partial [Nitratireductor sp.]|nr:RNA polymerase sigma factor RpoD [Nitratireductor sp.]